MKLGGRLKAGLGMACHWLMDTAQVRSSKLGAEKNSHGLNYSDWRGAIRGEYSAARKEWDFFGPVWHGGQAVKALVMAYQVTGEKAFLDSARNAAEFITRHQLTDKDPRLDGLILGYEGGHPDTVGTATVLEALDGL